MADQLAVTKLVAQHLNERWDNISATTDTVLGEQVDLVFDIEFEKLIKAYPWTFATVWREIPALTTDPDLPPHWKSALPYPDDARSVWEVMNPLGRDYPSIPFKIGYLENGRKVIFTNTGDAVVGFISDGPTITDAEEYFVDALSYRIAHRICLSVTGSAALKKDLQGAGMLAISEAYANNAIEGNEPDRDRDPDWLQAR